MKSETDKLQGWSYLQSCSHELSIHDAELVIQWPPHTHTTTNSGLAVLQPIHPAQNGSLIRKETLKDSLSLVRSMTYNKMIVNMKNTYFPKFSTWPRQVEKQ